MIYNKIGEKVVCSGYDCRSKTFYIGDKVVADINSGYYDLCGHILEISTGKDKETDNECEHDIIVNFELPQNKDAVNRLKKEWSVLYGLEKKLEDVALDYVVISADMIDRVYDDRSVVIKDENINSISLRKKFLQIEILKDENEESLREEVNEFIENIDAANVKLTWQAVFDNYRNGTMYICFIEIKKEV
jgi:hypothetical protein